MADVVVPDVVDGDIPPVPDKVRSSMLHIEDEAPLVIKDDIDIVLGGDDHPEINETDPDGKGVMHGFGYNITANEDGSIKYPEVVLDKDMIRTGLSNIARTLDTFEFAYSRYDGRNRAITNVQILEEYIHLRVIDLSGNRLKSVKCLATVKHLLVSVLNDNQLISLEEIPHLPFLQALSVKRNGLTSAEGLFQNSLTFLQLSYNKISNLVPFDADTYPNLTCLELRENNLTSLEGLNVPTLIRLFVAKNQLKSLEGLSNCTSLTHLHARDNLISNLENFPDLEKLEYVNLRGNGLKRFTQTKFLGNSPNIRTLIAMENPIATLSDYKMEMICVNLNLKRLDKQPVTEIELVQGRQILHGRENGTIPQVVDDEGLLTPPVIENEEEDEEDEADEENEEEEEEAEVDETDEDEKSDPTDETPANIGVEVKKRS